MDFEMLVNKDNPLDNDFVPCDLVEYKEYNGIKTDSTQKTLVNKEVLNSFIIMQQDGLKEGYHLILDSGYRSFTYQEMILKKNIEEMGIKAYMYVAIPGTSEHQSGLAIDIALNINGKYSDVFDDTFSEIIWAHNNAHKYGFILRYPKGKENITGYNYEFWHFRYVGKDLSIYMHENNIATLEEYYERKCKRS